MSAKSQEETLVAPERPDREPELVPALQQLVLVFVDRILPNSFQQARVRQRPSEPDFASSPRCVPRAAARGPDHRSA